MPRMGVIPPDSKYAVGMVYRDKVNISDSRIDNQVLESCRSFESDMPTNIYAYSQSKFLSGCSNWHLPDVPQYVATEDDLDSPE
jgi:hypothetical protein